MLKMSSHSLFSCILAPGSSLPVGFQSFKPKSSTFHPALTFFHGGGTLITLSLLTVHAIQIILTAWTSLSVKTLAMVKNIRAYFCHLAVVCRSSVNQHSSVTRSWRCWRPFPSSHQGKKPRHCCHTLTLIKAMYTREKPWDSKFCVYAVGEAGSTDRGPGLRRVSSSSTSCWPECKHANRGSTDANAAQ